METSNVKISKLKELIKIDTVSSFDDSFLKKCKDFEVTLRKLFPDLFKKCRIKNLDGSIIIEWPGRRSSAPILIISHFDTSFYNGKWSFDPLACEIVDDKVYGKGVIDAKGNIYCMLEACESLIKENFVPTQDIYFSFVSDKKGDDQAINNVYSYFRSIGSYFSYVLDDGGACLVSPFNGENKYCFVGVGERESALIKVKSFKSNNKKEESVLSRLGAFICEFEYGDIFKKSIDSSLYPLLEYFVNETSGYNKFVLSHPKLFKRLASSVLIKEFPFAASLVQSTLSFTKIESSSNMSSVSCEAYVIGDLRISLNDSLENCLNRIDKLAKYYNLEVEVIANDEDSRVSSVKSFQYMELEEAINDTFKDSVIVPYISYKTSDCRVLDRICSNCFRFVPFTLTCKQVSSIDSIDENIDIDSLNNAICFYRSLMQK